MLRWLSSLLLVAVLNAPALPVAAGEAREDTKVHSAGAWTDTLSAPAGEVYRVAMLELEKNDWTIQRADSGQGRIVTHWKKMDHALARLFFGDLQARCVVDVVPLADGSTALTLRGGLAGPPDLDRSPGFGPAMAAYRKAAERWVGRIRTTLDALATTASPGAH